MNFIKDASITIDNQAAAKAITDFHSAPGQHLIHFLLKQMSELTTNTKELSPLKSTGSQLTKESQETKRWTN